MRRPRADFAGIALAAMMRGAATAFPSNEPKLPLPPYLRVLDRRTRNRIFARAEARAENRRGQEKRRKKIAEYFSNKGNDWADRQKIINAMTGWQRTKWQRETDNDQRVEILERYASLPHWKAGGV